MTARPLSGLIVTLALLLLLAAGPALAQGPLRFFPITPCRVVDTRSTHSPAMCGKETRNFTMQGNCGVPTNAKAVALNATIVAPGTDGYLTLWPSDIAKPLAANLVYKANEPAIANGGIVALAPTTPGDVSAFVFLAVGPTPCPSGGPTAHLVLDVTGYFCKVDSGGNCIP